MDEEFAEINKDIRVTIVVCIANFEMQTAHEEEEKYIKKFHFVKKYDRFIGTVKILRQNEKCIT